MAMKFGLVGGVINMILAMLPIGNIRTLRVSAFLGWLCYVIIVFNSMCTK